MYSLYKKRSFWDFKILSAGFAATVLLLQMSSMALMPFFGQANAISGSQIVYSALPSVVPSTNYASYGMQPHGIEEYGDDIKLGGTNRVLDKVTLTMSNWAKFSTYATDSRYNTDSLNWTHPVTINVYSNTLDINGAPETLLATTTQTVTIPWRPESDPSCGLTSNGNGWKEGGDCYDFSGLAFNATFDLSSSNISLPENIIVSVEYSSQSRGTAPLGVDGPYNSLNYAFPANQSVSVGSDNNTTTSFARASWNTGYGTLTEFETNATYGTVAFQVTATAPTASSQIVRGNTSAGYNQPGWEFNRDSSTSTPYEFNADDHTLGLGSLYIKPIGSNAYDKFIGELFYGQPVSEFQSMSYDYRIAGPAGSAAKANEFYTNVYVTNTNSGAYFDCKFDFVPSVGSISSFENFSFNKSTVANNVTGPSCPTTLAGMPAGSYIRAFAINVGDTSVNDNGIGGYFDNVLVANSNEIKTYDMEPATAPSDLHFISMATSERLECDSVTTRQIVYPTWNDQSGESDFVRYEYQSRGGAATNLSGNQYVHSWTPPTDLTDGFRVRRVTTNSSSPWTSWCDITYDNTIPSEPVAPLWLNHDSETLGAFTNVNLVTPSWTAPSSAVDHFEYSFRSPISGWSAPSAFTATSIPDQSFYGAGDSGTEGLWQFRIRSVAASGLTSNWVDSPTLTYDRTKPVVTISDPSLAQVLGSTSTLNIQGSVSDINLRYYYCYLTTNQAITYNGSSFTPGQEVGVRNADCITKWTSVDVNGPLGKIDLIGLPDGDYTINLVAYDMASNNNASSPVMVSFTLDNTAPTGTFAGLSTSDTTPGLTGFSGDAVTVVVRVNGIPYNAVVNSGGWSLGDNIISPPLSVGNYTVELTTTDANGNSLTSLYTDSLNITAVLGASSTGGGYGAGGSGSGDAPQSRTNTGNTIVTAARRSNTVATTTNSDTAGQVEAATDEKNDSADAKPEVLQSTDLKNANSDLGDVKEGCSKLLGICWYWWLIPVAIVVLFIVYRIFKGDEE